MLFAKNNSISTAAWSAALTPLIVAIEDNNLADPFGTCIAVQSKRISPAAKAAACCLLAVIVGLNVTLKNFPIILFFYFF